MSRPRLAPKVRAAVSPHTARARPASAPQTDPRSPLALVKAKRTPTPEDGLAVRVARASTAGDGRTDRASAIEIAVAIVAHTSRPTRRAPTTARNVLHCTRTPSVGSI